jgi:hypothetical protein
MLRRIVPQQVIPRSGRHIAGTAFTRPRVAITEASSGNWIVGGLGGTAAHRQGQTFRPAREKNRWGPPARGLLRHGLAGVGTQQGASADS